MAKLRNPLEPLSTAVRIVVTVLCTVFVLMLLAAPFLNVSVFGIGSDSVCATDQASTIGGNDRRIPEEFAPAHGASIVLDANPRYCTKNPGAHQILLNTAGKFVPFAYLVGALLLTVRLIRGAERAGLYTAPTAGRLRVLGWWMVVGSLVSAVVESATESVLVATMSHAGTVQAVSGFWTFDVPFTAVFAGLGVLSFARIMRIGVGMREDLVGTV
ncbi:DUF2975 domain-containing protein [Streptomyces triticagri]|uniref:DUF2975 domain-containing protein n=1 Tax=Streptomyces triticagri TaxID=2293568 RepID=A0A372M4U6_9ACTN|nr:DUF2975 domain-containing protein [Streptomyces triticagri]RFU85901.1 DUF2975 domain-containing protein [Streptomyces triticagri]